MADLGVVQVPFDELKRRLYKRLARMGLTIEAADIIEQEASWIPLGGPLPKSNQRNVAFGAAAVMVHPASGYSIVNTLRYAQPVAEAIAKGLREQVITPGWSNRNLPVAEPCTPHPADWCLCAFRDAHATTLVVLGEGMPATERFGVACTAPLGIGSVSVHVGSTWE